MAIYNRQPGESSKSYTAFAIYRDLGSERSIDKAYRKAKNLEDSEQRAAGQWYIWACDHKWETRAGEYDDFLDAIARKAFEKRYAQIGRMRADYEFKQHRELDKSYDRAIKILEKATLAPITDVLRVEGSGKTKLVTKIKGVSLSGVARLMDGQRYSGREIILGARVMHRVPGAADDAKPERKSVMPQFLVDALTRTEPPDDTNLTKQ